MGYAPEARPCYQVSLSGVTCREVRYGFNHCSGFQNTVEYRRIKVWVCRIVFPKPLQHSLNHYQYQHKLSIVIPSPTIKTLRSLVVRVVDFRPMVRGLIESTNWLCVSAQVKYRSHVVIWTASKRTHNQYDTNCRFISHPLEYIYANCSISSVV